MNGAAQSMDGGGGGGNGCRRASRWETRDDSGGTIAVGDCNGGGGAMEGKTAVRSRCVA